MSKLITTLMAFVAFACGLVLLATAVSAYPYQLNLTDGTLIDLNSSNNMTNNITIYVITEAITINNTINNSYFNNTYFNSTNITTYQWDFGNSSSNVTNSTFDTRFVLFDSRYVEEVDFSSYKNALLFPTKTEFDALVTKVNNINITGTTTIVDEGSHGGLWSMMVISLLLALAGVVMAGMVIKQTREGSNDNTYSFP